MGPTGGEAADPPTAGETGIARTGADLTRLTLQEVTRGPDETLRRRLRQDDGQRQLAIASSS
ncbi:hypothetical protein ACF07Y_46330 [Streptomyces sp. NPDC016566]|uniref:hypothetical protein n=1 Tax=Streptomyces sp. NPDC016566 TaxID=3364967 RepID=UPI003702ABB5